MRSWSRILGVRLLVMADLQLETLALAPDGPNVDRARKWLEDGRRILRTLG